MAVDCGLLGFRCEFGVGGLESFVDVVGVLNL